MTAIRKRSAALRVAAPLAVSLAVSLPAAAVAAPGAPRPAAVLAAAHAAPGLRPHAVPGLRPRAAPGLRPHAVHGGTVYLADPPGVTPSFIFPFMSAATFSVANASQFQYLMYRPLYSFGGNGQPSLDGTESLAASPAYSGGDRTVTVTLRSYRWSDGEKVTAQDVVFWLNLLKVEKLDWVDYAPGALPDDLRSVTVDSPARLTLELSGAVDPVWFTYNELSQVTPLPMAWDVSAPGQAAGSQACATATYQAVSVRQSGSTLTPLSAAAKSCASVYGYLENESGYAPGPRHSPNNELSSYATNPLWAVVDGPFQLSSLDTSGKAVFVPNRRYSGPVKPTIAQLVEVPYASAAAELQALERGQLTVGYLPYADVTSPAPAPTSPGANDPRLGGYRLAPWYAYGVDFLSLNFDSAARHGAVGELFRQLYFRQVLQLLVDEPAAIQSVYKGYALAGYGPVPSLPPSPFLSGAPSEPYPYDAAAALGLLRAHGWSVRAGALSVCEESARCGVPRGTEASFSLRYFDGDPAVAQLLAVERSSFARAGIEMTLVPAAGEAVAARALACSGAGCTWQAADGGQGYLYSPAHYPSGEALFLPGGASNAGSYSDPAIEALIRQSDSAAAALSRYASAAAARLPVIWQPSPAYQLTEVEKGLQGVTPQDPYLTIDPEDWYFAKP